MKVLKYLDFESKAESGLNIHGSSLRFEFKFNGKYEKAKIANLSEINSQFEFEKTVTEASAKANVIKQLLLSDKFNADLYVQLLPLSKFAVNSKNSRSSKFGEIAQDYLHDLKRQVDAVQFARSTYENTKDTLNRWMFQKNSKISKKSKESRVMLIGLNNMPIADITAEDIKSIVYYMRETKKEDGTDYSTKYINDILQTIKQVFDYAIKELRIITDNPANNVKKLKGKSRNKKEVFTDQDLQSVNQWCNESGYQYLFHLLNFGCNTGLRKEEVLAIAWEDIIETDSGLYARINRAFTYKEYKSTKTEVSERIIPVFPPAIASLAYMRGLTAHLDPVEIETRRAEIGAIEKESVRFVFLNLTDRSTKKRTRYEPWNEFTLRKAWNKVRAGSGVDKPLNLVRHTYATTSLHIGADIKTTSLLLGHSDTQMLEKTYEQADFMDATLINRLNSQRNFTREDYAEAIELYQKSSKSHPINTP